MQTHVLPFGIDLQYRPAPILVGEGGKRLQKKIWFEIMDALQKDVPGVADLV